MAFALPALAAEPGEGTVGAAVGEVTWTGAVTGDPTGAVLDAMSEAGGTNGACTADTCDEYTLHVVDAGRRLQVDVQSTAGPDDAVAIEVEDPGGATTFAYAKATTATLSLDDPAVGDYVLRVLASPGTPATTASGVPYAGRATLLGVAAATPTATATATATPTAAPTGTATPAPAATAPPTAAATPVRTLALQADRRRISTALSTGIRARSRCAGGCSRVEVAAFVSPLTARRLGLGRQRADVRVALAPVTTGEGRKVHTLVFERRLRNRLRRSKRLDLAVEAVVTDPDGRRRTAIHRITLKRR